MEEEILKILRNAKSGFVSGEDISFALNVSRTAVWKRIKKLKQIGYKIDAHPRSGYRLIDCPDILTPSELNPLLETEWIGKKIHYFQEIDSTNSKAYQIASLGAKEGEIVIAESQKKGRGRLGRTWVSPPYLNLYLSIILRPNILPNQAPLITLLSAVATAEAIKRFSGITLSIKWPNDILIDGRKLAGILNEINSEMDRINFVIIGIGININMDKNKFPKELRQKATSLKIETGKNVSRKELTCVLLKEIEDWYKIFLENGAQPIIEAWRKWADIKGKMVKVSSFQETIVGRAIDIDSEGALIIEIEKGEFKKIIAGDVEYQDRESIKESENHGRQYATGN